MKFNVFAWVFGIACLAVAAAVLVLHRPAPPAPAATVALQPPPTTWPDYSQAGTGFTEPAGEQGPTIAYGYALLTRTYAVIGPEAPDAALRFAGNNLACTNCHLDGGTNRNALPLVGIAKAYPKFSERAQRVVSLTDRVNECMTRSMNGRSLPDSSRQMTALIAFLRYVGDPAPAPAPAAPETPPLPADRTRGQIVYATVCAACHQQNGLGQRRGSLNDADGYAFPPLWGPDSYNDGAGMDRYQRIVPFVRSNMPRGVDPLHPQLTLQQAWDVSAYVIAQPRPHYAPQR